MAEEIKKLNPNRVWSIFYDLTQIPRPTGQAEEAANYVYNFGRSLGLETERDEVGNVVIRKPATPGFEDRKTVTMQGHVDMVPQKNSSVQHDFSKDPIDAYIDGDWVRARETTLGADNGIGAALALAVMEDNTLKHGPLEAFFTIDEEVGMVGANGLKPGFLKGDILMNLDSESEGELFVGCAGGIDVNVSFRFKDDEVIPEGDVAMKISLTGLKGGHSGMDINLGRANANKLMFRLLKEAVCHTGARLSWVEGGSLRNAIPREAFAIVTFPEEETESLLELVSDYQDIYRQEFSAVEPNLKLVAEQTATPKTLMPVEIQDDLINAIEGCQNGPLSMLTTFPGTVESSTNLASVASKPGLIEVKFLTRSSSETKKDMVCSSLESIFSLAGAKVEFDASYNGWEPNVESHVMHVMLDTYQELFNKKPEIKVIHAGLECGIIQGVMKNMDMISFGPDILHPHSPDEKVNIASVEKTWVFLTKALERI